MKKYVVAYLSFFDNNIELQTISAESELEACTQVVGDKGWDSLEFSSMENLKETLYNGDCLVEVIEC